MIDIKLLSTKLRAFAADRDWDQFHTPKNLATSIVVEAAELLEIFQWTRGQTSWSDVQDSKVRPHIEEELADILLYIIRFADKANIDLQKATETKLVSNAVKYPVEGFKGSDKKYNE